MNDKFGVLTYHKNFYSIQAGIQAFSFIDSKIYLIPKK